MESTCLYDASNCSNVMPGEQCEIFCEAPYVGTPTVGRCVDGNVFSNTSLLWAPPVCNHSVCPAQNGSAEGYALAEAQGVAAWRCAAGYGGEAVESCPVDVSENCSSDTVLAGALAYLIYLHFFDLFIRRRKVT